VPRVIHFEIQADDPKRAVQFYKKVFGWKINKWKGPMDYWMVATGKSPEPGIDGAIMRRLKKNTMINYVSVPSVDKFLAKILKAGGKVIMPKTPIPGMGFYAYCADTEKNVFGIMEMDPSAH
jgi:predicted enzyme related to lactoylglutathione lyase